jgi:hypothetical protein
MHDANLPMAAGVLALIPRGAEAAGRAALLRCGKLIDSMNPVSEAFADVRPHGAPAPAHGSSAAAPRLREIPYNYTS